MEALLAYLDGLGPLLGLMGTILGLVGMASGIVVGWAGAKRQMRAEHRKGKSRAIDDLDQVRKALMEEINRLSSKVTHLEQENEALRAEMKEMQAENARLTQRVEELEALNREAKAPQEQHRLISDSQQTIQPEE